MTRSKLMAIASIFIIAATMLMLNPPNDQSSDEKTTTLNLRTSGNSTYIDVSHRQYMTIELEKHEEIYLRLLFDIEVRGPKNNFTIRTVETNLGFEGTDFNVELDKLPKYCSMGLQHVLTDTQGAVGNDTVQFAVITFLRAGSNDWTVKDPKVTVKNLVLEFDESLLNRSSPMVLMNVEASLLNETQYVEWLGLYTPPQQEIQIHDATVRSIVNYDTANNTDLMYGLIFNAWVTNSDGLDDIANVTVTYPDGTVIPLQDEGEGWGYHPAGDGEYFNIAGVNYTITGTFTFEVSDWDGHSAKTTEFLDEWLQPFDWVRPASQEIVNVTETDLIFNSSETDLQNFVINLGNTTVKEGFWSIAANSTHVEYDGDIPLPTGEYWWTLSAESEKGNKIQAYTQFEIVK
jgi:hypothetical protein